MDSRLERTSCTCGRPLVRWILSYELGRKGSMPYRMVDRWRHEDDNTLACEEPAGE